MAFAGTSYEETNAVATLQYCIRKDSTCTFMFIPTVCVN